MTTWNLHFLNARHAVTRHMAEIRAAAKQAVALASEHADVPDFDLVIRALPNGGIPDWGVGGHAPSPGVIEVTVNPDRYSDAYLIRTLIHEMHHLMRWDGPGYGKSLGAALVSEGLAGHFVLQVLGGKPDPWDAVRPSSGVARQAMNEWSRLDYDHARWFFGRGDLRKWTGYGLGHKLIAEHLATAPEDSAAGLAAAPADTFRPVMRRLLAGEGDDTPDEVVESDAADAKPADAGSPDADKN
ncbi:DUF2268 domain-containing putative Zn-dependent protease [Paracoccus sp. JM45]|uniref:DUF2268 domain-containing putative Zn-dependent protease n=1 Tax=Paracoccus sp. JM45 TaxID=2283626 RepID=UPI000E6C77D8|nr:DUF2268 domain-containing putative Zn-dependent protease [Paracoccus sp. JM45]RJE79365.1 hypothetical protein DWB67_12260 [Paracoccus sp. JM45]